jgi:hypothetical protein
MSNKSIHIKPTPYYRKRQHSTTYKVGIILAAALTWAAVIIGGVAVN